MSFAQFILNKATKSAADAEIMARRRADGRKTEPKRTPKKRGRPAFKWSIERDILLEELAKEFSGPEIAEKMGTTPNSIRSRATRIGVSLLHVKSTYHHWSPEDFKRLRELYNQDLTSIAIGKIMGLTDIQIRGALNRLKLTGKRKIWNTDMEFTVAKWFNHFDNDTLCNALGIKESAVKCRYMKLSREKRLFDMRDSCEHEDLVVAYCNRNGLDLPRRAKR
ncbi:MAG: hypothetical protein [Bacteriophage sp.]|nr:MAG: hypothetical protein [Bacteriophage sp.]